jgi:multidrug resistance efflux pump
MSKRAPILLVLGVVAVGGIFYWKYRSEETNPLQFSGVVETREVQIGSKVGGRVTEVRVREGQKVSSGEQLIRIDGSELEATRRQLQSRLQQARAELTKLERGNRKEEIAQAEAAVQRERAVLEELRKGPRPQELEQAAAEVAAAQAEATNAKRSLERFERLSKTGDIAAQTLDDARARYEAAEARVEAVRQRYEVLKAGTRQEQIRAGEARLEQAAAAAQLARAGFRGEEIDAARARVREGSALLDENAVQLAEMELRAPQTCGIEQCQVEVVSVRPGDLAAANKAVVTVLEFSQRWVRAYVPEPQLGRISVGEKVSVSVDTYPDRAVRGDIEQISSQAEFLPRNIQTRDDRNHQVFGIKVRIEDPSVLLKPGMAATVRVSEP